MWLLRMLINEIFSKEKHNVRLITQIGCKKIMYTTVLFNWILVTQDLKLYVAHKNAYKWKKEKHNVRLITQTSVDAKL